MYVVYKKSKGRGRIYLAVFEHKIEAEDWCDQHNWELVDKNGTSWYLAYVKV